MQHTHAEASYALFRTLVKSPYFGLCLSHFLTVSLLSRKKCLCGLHLYSSSTHFEKHIIKKRETWEKKNHHYVLYMKKKFSLALLSVTELDIKYRLNANMFQWFRNDLRMEALCRVVCKVFSIFHILLLNCHLSCNNMYKTTERQEVIRIIHFCWEEVWFYCFSKSIQKKFLICFSLLIFFYNPDILQILGLVLIHHTYLWPMLDKK